MREKSKAGYVYAIENPRAQAVKIGKAGPNGCRRRRYWQAELWNMDPLYVHSESYHEDAYAAEREAHQRLAHARVGAEWFSLKDPEVTRWLAERSIGP